MCDPGKDVNPGLFSAFVVQTSWNIHSPSVVERDGKGSHPAIVYAASKALAERAAWDFYEADKPAYDLTAALPVYNFGPYLHDVSLVFLLKLSVHWRTTDAIVGFPGHEGEGHWE